MPVWAPEIVVDEPLVRRLLAQFPELGGSSLRRLAVGWDNSVWLVDERYAFRFPQRAVVIPGVGREIAVLPRLAPLLPLPVPQPVFVGRQDEDYPWPFFGAELITGVEAGEAELDDDARSAVGLELAGFLRALHSIELDVELPYDPNRRTDMGRRTELAREAVAELERLGVWRARGRLEHLFATALALPPPEPPVIVHGDLHFRHLLVHGGAAAGVIDWVDICRSDPAIDLPLLWSFVPPAGRGTFLDAYGAVTEPQLVRARLLAVQLCATLAHYGRVEGQPALVQAAVDGLERTLLDWEGLAE